MLRNRPFVVVVRAEMIALSIEDRVVGFAGRVLYARHDTRARLYRSRLLAQDLRRLGDQLS